MGTFPNGFDKRDYVKVTHQKSRVRFARILRRNEVKLRILRLPVKVEVSNQIA